MRRVDAIKEYLSDGQPRKLNDIVKGIERLGIKGTPSSQYIAVYQELREHPELFLKTKMGVYAMKDTSQNWIKMDPSNVVFEIEEILTAKPNQTPSQVWRALLQKGIQITYKSAQNLLTTHFSKDQYARYRVD